MKTSVQFVPAAASWAILVGGIDRELLDAVDIGLGIVKERGQHRSGENGPLVAPEEIAGAIAEFSITPKISAERPEFRIGSAMRPRFTMFSVRSGVRSTCSPNCASRSLPTPGCRIIRSTAPSP